MDLLADAQSADVPDSALVGPQLPPPPEKKPFSAAWTLAPLAGSLADAYTTQKFMQGGYGLKEGNPFMGGLVKNPPLWYAAKAAMGLGPGLLLRDYSKEHPTQAKIISALAAAIPGLLAARNMQMMQSRR